jgi:hypothetical protein
MIIIGLLLLIIAVVFGIDFVWKNNVHIANPTVFGERLGIHSAASLFVVGAITGAAILLGVALLCGGVRRKGAHAMSRRRERTETQHLREERETQDRSQNEPGFSADNEQAQSTEAGPAHPTGNEEPGSRLNRSDTEAAPVATAPAEHLTEASDADQPQEVSPR